MSTNKNVYVCKRLRLYNELVRAGFEPIAMRKDYFNPNYHVWIFKNTEELQSIVNNYYSKFSSK